VNQLTLGSPFLANKNIRFGAPRRPDVRFVGNNARGSAGAAADPSSTEPTAPRAKRVLALFDFAKDAPANVIWDAALRETLDIAGSQPRIEYYTEFFDASRFTDPAHTAVMHDYLRRKYAGLTIAPNRSCS